jgi:hypothetical protein
MDEIAKQKNKKTSIDCGAFYSKPDWGKMLLEIKTY